MTSCNKKSLTDQNKEFVLFLSRLTTQDRNRIIDVLGGQYINTISEIFQNFLKKNLTQDLNDIRKLVGYRKEVREIALKKTPIHIKKRILQSRKGGAILSVLLPLAAGLITSLLR